MHSTNSTPNVMSGDVGFDAYCAHLRTVRLLVRDLGDNEAAWQRHFAQVRERHERYGRPYTIPSFCATREA